MDNEMNQMLAKLEMLSNLAELNSQLGAANGDKQQESEVFENFLYKMKDKAEAGDPAAKMTIVELMKLVGEAKEEHKAEQQKKKSDGSNVVSFDDYKKSNDGGDPFFH
ncbi:hypothetical protein [Halobacillus ihumii]|uniref:hypothetical protein n=1 Tax=Halobacillus ihumii TaxID=2686092 RepID=UPI0013D4AE4E|nr:hypothetical protein [Halobacillus ihumii]